MSKRNPMPKGAKCSMSQDDLNQLMEFIHGSLESIRENAKLLIQEVEDLEYRMDNFEG